jgi:hypothetical protein
MMEPGSPWIELPDKWRDDRLTSHQGYRAFQEYFCISVKPEVINEYLLGEGICAAARIEVERFNAREILGNLSVEGVMRVTGTLKQGGVGTDTIKIKRTFSRNDGECHFDLMGASKVTIDGFGVPYYRRVIPLLRKLGIQKITTMPTTTAERSQERNRLVGAYVWSSYGYSNDTMDRTLNQYIGWLKQIKGMKLTPDQENKIKSIPRMFLLARDKQPNGEKTGKKFLLGMDARDTPTREIWWHGTHHNINDESPHNEEMTELIAYLFKKIQ